MPITKHIRLKLISRLMPALMFAPSVLAGTNGPLPWLNAKTPYLIYYGNWTTSMVNYARTNYRMVILHPGSDVTPAQISTIRSGPDGILGTADDVKVLAYLSVGEDDRAAAPIVGDGLGPRVDPRASETDPLSSITNALGAPSAGGTGYASYYFNSTSNQTGNPGPRSQLSGSYYVNAGAPAWWTVNQEHDQSRPAAKRVSDEILTTNVGNALNCDGVFLDTHRHRRTR